jgi:hypothetical protein
MTSSPTIIVIKIVSRWRRMVVGVKLHCFGMRLENKMILDLTYSRKPRSKFVWLGRTFESCNQDKRATPIIGEEN